jgi:autophagy-related protein 5
MNPQDFIDERIQDSVWETKIPLKIEMSDKDLISGNKPLTLYFSLPRTSYIVSIYPDLIKAFENCVSAKLPDLWLNYNNIPIKWQYPLGVLVDSLGIDINHGPVLLKVRVREMPNDQVLKCESVNSLKEYVSQALKEADVLKHPLGKPYIRAEIKLTDKMKQIFYENDPKNITEWRKIMKSIEERDQEIKKYPTKLIFCKTELILTKPALIPHGEEKNYSIGKYLSDVLSPNTYESLKKKCRVLVHGLEIEEDMQYLFYYYNFCYMDNFLYVVFQTK